MKTIFAIALLMGFFSFAYAEDFYSINDSLFSANKLNMVEKNALARLRVDGTSLEATYFMALVTTRKSADLNGSNVFVENSYADNFQSLYRDQAKIKGLMYGDQIMMSDPRFVRLFYYLGLKYLSQNDFKKAIEWLNLAEIGYSDNLDFNINIGNSYYAIKNYDKARKYYETVLSIAPEHGDTLYNMACLESVLHRPDESIVWLRKALRADAKYKEIALKDSDLDNIRNNKQYRQLMAN